MPEPTVRQQVEAVASTLSKARSAVGQRGANLAKVAQQLDEYPRTVPELAAMLGVDAASATEALARLQQLDEMVEQALQTVGRQICFLDRAIRQRNNTEINEFKRLKYMRALLSVGTNADPDDAYERVNWTQLDRNAKFEMHDNFTRGMMRVGYGTARFVGSMTGGTDLMTVVFGVNDEGKKVGFGERAAAFLGLAGGALLSDAAKSMHLESLVRNRAGHNAATRQAQRQAHATGNYDGDVATSQTSSKPSGTIADLESMGIPVENFHKIQQRMKEANGHAVLRPTGIDAPDQLRRGAVPKPMKYKSKTSKDIDALLGSDPTKPGCCAAFQPGTKFFEDAMRASGMDDATIAARLDDISAGKQVDAPPGFADEGLWAATNKRYTFRQKEWNGPIGEGVRKMVEKGDAELRGGIVHEIVDGEPKPVTGDHDPFEWFVDGRAATPAEEAAFVAVLKGDGAAIEHGAHVRWDPQLDDYTPGGRFDMKLDPKKYTPEQMRAKAEAKFNADRDIFEVIMDKHSRQALSDDVLRSMDGFVEPNRNHYPDGPYGDLRHRQDTALHQRWNDLRDPTIEVGPAHGADAEVLVVIGPDGPPYIIRAGELPANFDGIVIPVDVGPVGSNATLPRGLLFWGSTGLRVERIAWDDDALSDWFFRWDEIVEAPPTCIDEDPDELIALPDGGFPWKPVAAAAAALAIIGGGIGIATAGDSEEAAPEATVIVEDEPVVTIGETPVVDDPEPADPEPTEEPAPTPDAISFGVGNPCGDVTHTPHPDHTSSLSWFELSFVVVPTDGGELPAGTTVEADTPGADLAMVSGPVAPDGVVSDLIVPISAYGVYPIPEVRVLAPGGAPFAALLPEVQVIVDAAEGPVGGCTPAGQLDGDQVGDVVDAVRGQTVPAGGGGAGAGGAPAVATNDEAFPPPEDDLGPYREFFTRYETAHRDGDADALFDALHPAVIGRYGEAQCRSYIDQVVGSVAELRVVSGMTSAWDYPLDGLTTEIAGSVSIALEGEFGGVQQQPEVHVAPAEGAIRWFADCGEPLVDT